VTQEDLEEYEDEPDQFIKNDIEESDQESRRRNCMNLVQALSRKYSGDMS